jgi:hypothetical protein
MKLKFTSAERTTLVAQLGLADSASDADIGGAVAARLMGGDPSPQPAPSGAAAAASQASGPEEYPAAWLSPSDLAPWPRPIPRVKPVERVTAEP